jgi:hypothetical protein
VKPFSLPNFRKPVSGEKNSLPVKVVGTKTVQNANPQLGELFPHFFSNNFPEVKMLGNK